ncbi:hypothetical protein HYH03_003888 [Edaphochlamys debaryana]|uniref:phytol kinase n=1 Tax=Edaphochlamys debaryana TaxID=47281 RepID=A0A836C2U2_9CHLO|nr:hypothetical protein HYH03_003888 [Edaphochlamys debaryana]|eukprot:KAG2498130.1 hypothetical protein HYH03_003888 [Edaphochlamys debaryana]
MVQLRGHDFSAEVADLVRSCAAGATRLPEQAAYFSCCLQACAGFTFMLTHADSGVGMAAVTALLPAVVGAVMRMPLPGDSESSAPGDVSDAAAYAMLTVAALDDGTRSAILSDPAVAALRAAMQRRLLVHGGVVAEAGEWWMTELEEERGQVIGEVTLTRLEMVHAAVVRTAPFDDPRVNARVLEAICRMYRGEGMGGASRSYRVAPTFIPCTSALLALLEKNPTGDSAAWTLALCAHRLDAVLAVLAAPAGGEAGGEADLKIAVSVMSALVSMKRHLADDAEALLGASSKEELRVQLSRVGLAATLDRLTRLAFRAADLAAGAASDAAVQDLAQGLAGIPTLAGVMLYDMRHLIGCGPDGGLLVTLAKRAVMVTRRLHELEGRDGERELLAGIVGSLLPALSHGMNAAQDSELTGPESASLDAVAFLGRSACLLVTQVASRAVARRVGVTTAINLHRVAMMNALDYLKNSLSSAVGRYQLSAAQVLALQPQRLLVAAYKLLCAHDDYATLMPHLLLPVLVLHTRTEPELRTRVHAAAAALALPPPLVMPLAEVAFKDLCVCANAACTSYGGRAEAELPLKRCGRCGCVRYCCAACQAADWKAGHKRECKARDGP